ncbi:MAG: hypothetical protein QG580_136 [Patescibacteria group bacterium]|jgi:hypothetical protein|nr:hypothetical protein [Patescibacteria group bacterium]
MISFLKREKILGLDITEEYVRYALVLNSYKGSRILEAGTEKIPRVEPRNALMSAILNILRKTKCKKANISIQSDIVKHYLVSIKKETPKNFIKEELIIKLKESDPVSVKNDIFYFNKRFTENNFDFYDIFVTDNLNISFFKSVFENTGLVVKKVIKRSDALQNSCIPKGQLKSTMIINYENFDLDVSIYNLFNQYKDFHINANKDNVYLEIKKIHVEYFNQNEENINSFLLSGSFAADIYFLNTLKRFSGFPIKQADVFINLLNTKNQLPVVTKDESFSFAIAIGAAII